MVRCGGGESRGPAELGRRAAGLQCCDGFTDGGRPLLGAEQRATCPLQKLALEPGEQSLEMTRVGLGIAAEQVGLGVNLPGEAGPIGGIAKRAG
jgi:hypothetical protein